jgi:hypothetical protein
VSPTTSLGYLGGTVTVSAVVTDATSCAFSSSKATAGAPSTVPCTTGAVSDTFSVPANPSKRAKTVKLQLTVTGSKQVKAKTSVVVGAPGNCPQPAAGADFSGCNLAYADLSSASLANATFTGAALTGTVLAHADLTGADLSGVTMPGSDLTGAHLAGADLTSSVLTGAHLAGAVLTSATVTGADLTGADLTGADFSAADVSGVIWSATTCPDGSLSSASSPETCIGHGI